MNVSFDGEDLILNKNKDYIIIDSLYVQNAKRHSDILRNKGLTEFKRIAFPYNKVPFGIFTTSSDSFVLRLINIRKEDYNAIDLTSKCFFSCDTGLMLIAEELILPKVLDLFNYDDLLDTMTEDYNTKYWENFCAQFTQGSVNLLSSPGADSGFEFEGSGTYSLTI